jgi:hypothetical protein
VNAAGGCFVTVTHAGSIGSRVGTTLTAGGFARSVQRASDERQSSQAGAREGGASQAQKIE